MEVDEDVFLSDLPRELLEATLSQLDAVSQQRIRRVCPVWNELITDPYGDCRHQVSIELPSGGHMSLSEKNPTPLDHHPQTAFALCVGQETRDVVFCQPRPVSGVWTRSSCRYLYPTLALFMRLEDIISNSKSNTNGGHPIVLRRLVFANLILPPSALSRMILCCPERVREVWLRNVTLVAPLELSTGLFCMVIPGVNQRYNTTKDVEPFGGREDYTWAKYVAGCGGPLSAVEEHLVLESLRNRVLVEKLKQELRDGNVAGTLHSHFRGGFESMDAKDFTVGWLRRFDVWTVRFLFHYFVSVCKVQPVQ